MPYKIETKKKGIAVTKWRAQKMITGQRKTKLFKTKIEAKKWEAMFSSENLKKMQIDMVSLIEWANGYLDHAKGTVVEKTYKDEKVPALKRLLKSFSPEMTVDKLTPHDCLKFLSKQNQDRSGNAANKDRKNLSAGWNWGVKFMNLPKDNPFMAVDPFPTEEKPRYVPPEEDFWKVFEIASPEQKILLLAFLHTSARRGELFRLRWDDIDFERNLARLGTRKRVGGSLEYNIVSITEELKQALSEKKKSSSSVYVFCDEYGEPFKYRQHLLRRLCSRINVKKFGFHSIRHLSASILASEGTDIPTIQSQLRHKHLHTTSRYLHKLGATDNVMEKVFGDRKQARCSI